MHLCNRVDRRSKSQNISELAFSLNRYHNSATPLFYSETQSDISFLIILCKDNTFFRKMQIHLTYRNTLRNVKRRVLHNLGFAKCYITRRAPKADIRRRERRCCRWLNTHIWQSRKACALLLHRSSLFCRAMGCRRSTFATQSHRTAVHKRTATRLWPNGGDSLARLQYPLSHVGFSPPLLLS